MKKLLGITLCLVIVMALTANAFSMGLEAAPPEEMLLWYEMIDAIGEVTLEDEDAIDEIWSHYIEYGYAIFIDTKLKPPANFKKYYDKMLQITEEFDALLAAATPSVPQPTEPAPTEPQPTEPAPTEPQPTEPAPTEPQPTEPAPTEPQPTEPAPTEPKPTEPTHKETRPVEPTPDEPQSYTFVIIAAAALLLTLIVVLISRKKLSK